MNCKIYIFFLVIGMSVSFFTLGESVELPQAACSSKYLSKYYYKKLYLMSVYVWNCITTIKRIYGC